MAEIKIAPREYWPRVANIIPNSEANGPGVRTVVHFGGCTLGCAGCFNPQLWPKESGSYRIVHPLELARELSAMGPHFTFSGGEPLQQPLLHVLMLELKHLLREQDPSFVIYTGYVWQELWGMAYFAATMADALVMGRYNSAKAADDGFCSTTNQQLRLLSTRYTPADFNRKVEVIVDTAGQKTITGIPTEELRKELA